MLGDQQCDWILLGGSVQWTASANPWHYFATFLEICPPNGGQGALFRIRVFSDVPSGRLWPSSLPPR